VWRHYKPKTKERGQTDHTRFGDTGGGKDTPLFLVKEWRGGPRRVHVFEFCRLLFSLRVLRTPLRESALREFGKPNSAPLINPVDTITPVPLLDHVRTFSIVRYNPPTTQPSQPNYTTNEHRKRNKRRINKIKTKKAKNKQIHTLCQTKYDEHIHVNIKIITTTTSTTNIQIHQFKRHSTS